MKYLLLFCSLWPSVACGQVVQAQFTDFSPDKLGPLCGILAVANMLQFRVLDSQAPQQAGDTILVVLPCPLGQGQNFFVNGARYELNLHNLAKEPQWQQGWTLLSPYEQLGWPRSWCRSITRVK